MRRKTFDVLATAGGALVVVALLVAGALLMVGANFANTNVHSQLAEQQITFPPASAFAHPVAPAPGTFSEVTPSMIPSVSQFAGQQLTTGAQAQAYANDFIGEHVTQIGGGKTYAQLSATAMALPKGSKAYAAVESQVQSVLQGTTLRGLLLEAYGFSVFGTIAMWASIASFSLAGLMLLLVLAGLWHSRRVAETTELLRSKAAAAPRGVLVPA